VCLLLLRPVMGSLPALLTVCAVWGMAMSAVNLVLQYNVVKVAPDATDIAMSIYSGIYNIGIGSGALVGGLVTVHMGLEAVDNVAGAIAVAASLWCLYYLRRVG